MIGTTGKPIYLPTPQPGTDQITHPSVVWVPDGWNGHPYWMAATPYDGNNAQYENPCIYFSDDGVKWSPIAGNPIVGAPANGYNSDPCLVLDGDKLVCAWRETVARTHETLRTATSSDGVTWQSGPVVYSGSNFTDHLSPTLVRTDGVWLLFSVQRVVGGLNRVRRFAASSLGGPWDEQPCEGLTTPDGREPWHLWVGRGDDGWHAILNDTDRERSGGRGNLYHSRSIDGHKWSEPTTCLPTLSTWHDSLYQACAVWRCGGLDVWYSAATPMWQIGLARLTQPGALQVSFGILASSHPPAATAGWTDLNLLNSWVDFGAATFDSPAYDTQTAAYTRGLIKDGTTTGGTTIADNLPAPSGTVISSVAIAGGTPYNPAFVDVDSSGQLLTRSAVNATGTYISLCKYLPSAVSKTAPTLGNSWVDYGGAFEGAGYCKDADGTVYLQGLIKNGTATAGTVLFTLPTGYRPGARLVFAVASNNTISRVDVYANGEVQIIAGSNTWLSLTGISFTTATNTAPTLSNSWVNYGGGTFGNAGYYKDSSGVVHLTGLIKSGTTTDDTIIMTLPSGHRPTNNILRPTLTTGGTAYIYIESDGEVKITDASSAWLSLDGFSFSTTA